MKVCQFRELLVVSHVDRAARQIKFDPKANVLLGRNDTGKSSLIKTLYWTLGAEPWLVTDKWKAANVKALLSVSIDGVTLDILRDGSFFGVFHAGALIHRSDRVTSQLAPFLAGRFDFKLQIPGRDNKPSTPTPAFLYLPFYVDQDGGWVSNWNSFAKLNQFPGWKADVIEYHAGIKPNAYYVAKAEHHLLEQKAVGPKTKRLALNSIKDDVTRRLAETTFDVDLNSYKKEVDELIQRCNNLRGAEEQYRLALSDIENRRSILTAQHDIVGHIEKELRKDFEYASSKLPDVVPCPTCGQEYENAFEQRFDLAHDEDRCLELASELKKDLDAVDQQRLDVESKLEAVRKDFEAASALLERKQGEVTLQQLIRNEGRREVKHLLNEDVDALDREIKVLDEAIDAAKERMRKLLSPDRRKEILSQYRESMRQYLIRLNVLSLPEAAVQNMLARIRAGGSDGPRAVLAYTVAFLHLIARYSTSTVFPVVIDAVNQQEQDPANLKRMLEFIRDEVPKSMQLIIGLVDDRDVDFGGQVIRFEKSFGALRQEEYPAVTTRIRPFLEATAS